MLISKEEQAATRVAAAPFVLCSEGSRIRIIHACFSQPLLFFITFNYIFRQYCPVLYIYLCHMNRHNMCHCVALHLGHLHAPDQTMSCRERELILTL